MNDCFVDSCVVARWILAEADSLQALRVVTDTTASGGELYVLDLAIIEVANVIRTRHHRNLLTLAEANQAFALLKPPVPKAVGIPAMKEK